MDRPAVELLPPRWVRLRAPGYAFLWPLALRKVARGAAGYAAGICVPLRASASGAAHARALGLQCTVACAGEATSWRNNGALGFGRPVALLIPGPNGPDPGLGIGARPACYIELSGVNLLCYFSRSLSFPPARWFCSGRPRSSRYPI